VRLSSTHEMQPLCIHDDFVEDGIIAALRRLLDALTKELPDDYRRLVGKRTPSWVLEPNFAEACSKTTARDAIEYSRRFQKVLRRLKLIEEPVVVGFHCDDDDRVDRVEQAVSAARMSCGSMLEVYAKLCSLRLADIGHAPKTEVGRSRFARLCSDAYFAALWTDSHAVFSMDVCGHDSRISTTFGDHIHTSCPNIRSTMSLSSIPSFANTFLRGYSHGTGSMSESERLIFHLLNRCTQCGSRGWENSLAYALKNEAANMVATKIFASSLMGMHPQLHPAARLPWDGRYVLSARLMSIPPAAMTTLIATSYACMKECTRILCCSLMTELPAVSSAYAHLSHPIGSLTSTPLELTATSLQVASVLIANAGRKFQNPAFNIEFFAPLLNALINNDQRTRRKSVANASVATMTAISKTTQKSGSCSTAIIPSGQRSAIVVFETQEELVYSASWLGKNQRITATRPATLQVVSEILARAFRAEFVPVWLHCFTNDIRITRLNVVQHIAIHNGSSTHRLTSELHENIALRVQRLALSPMVSCSINIGTVATILGMDKKTVNMLSASTNMDDSITRFMSLEKLDAAKLVLFCKVLCIKDRMLSFCLGPKTRELQLKAVKRRYGIDDGESQNCGLNADELTSSGRLPSHALTLFVCHECGRVANAHVNSQTKNVPHNEIGLSQTMLRVAEIGQCNEVRCARRSSAGLRATMQRIFEVASNRIEEMPIKPKLFTRKNDSSHSARLRRDVRSCASQSHTAIACGDRPMLSIPLLGRVVRVNGGWYSLCATCGSTLRVLQKHRYKGEFCCLRCDPSSLKISCASSSSSSTPLPPLPPPPVSSKKRLLTAHERNENDEDDESTCATRVLHCRFCGKPSGSTAASRFKILAAPCDDGGINGPLPPPLRRVCYCSSHYRAWLDTAHRTMPTNVIFAHLATKSVPVFGADGSRKALTEQLRLENKRARPKESAESKRLGKMLKRVKR